MFFPNKVIHAPKFALFRDSIYIDSWLRVLANLKKQSDGTRTVGQISKKPQTKWNKASVTILSKPSRNLQAYFIKCWLQIHYKGKKDYFYHWLVSKWKENLRKLNDILEGFENLWRFAGKLFQDEIFYLFWKPWHLVISSLKLKGIYIYCFKTFWFYLIKQQLYLQANMYDWRYF